MDCKTLFKEGAALHETAPGVTSSGWQVQRSAWLCGCSGGLSEAVCHHRAPGYSHCQKTAAFKRITQRSTARNSSLLILPLIQAIVSGTHVAGAAEAGDGGDATFSQTIPYFA